MNGGCKHEQACRNCGQRESFHPSQRKDQKKQIIQIIPAPAGWGAQYKLDDGTLCTWPLFCIALVDDGEEREITPMVCDALGIVSDSAESDNFERIISPEDTPSGGIGAP